MTIKKVFFSREFENPDFEMKKFALIIVVIVLNTGSLFPQDWRLLKSLKGSWLFSIGDESDWAGMNFRDNNWESIRVPSSWENEGFHGYNGFAWYRKHFTIKSDYRSKVIYLKLGRVDDVDEVYLNGKLIGSTGSFPPDYKTAYFAWREYYIPSEFFNYDGDNVIAVRVYDSELEGGIVEGDVSLFEDVRAVKISYDLSGQWKFNTGDDMERKNAGFNDKDWGSIIVPGFWESQGYPDYDGFAWYRKKFIPPSRLSGENLVLFLGKIDDIDEVYVNGKLIGTTGNLNRRPIRYDTYGEYNQIRGYYIPKDLLKFNQENTVAVRVYDGFKDGGIYRGPVGLVKQKDYSDFIRNNRSEEKKNFWDWLFND